MNNAEHFEPLLTSEETAHHLRMHVKTLQRLAREARIAVCTGLRVSELLALRWDHFDFVEGTLLVQSGTVNGRVGAVKTLASNDYVPLAPVFQAALEAFRNGKREGLVLPSHKIGVAISLARFRRTTCVPPAKRWAFEASDGTR